MTAPRPTVCLSMIVKDEAPVVARCLASVRPLIDRWVVVDTGSSDGTQDIVRQALAGVPGELVERPWRDFAHNRSEALTLARPHADYALIVDADDELVAPEGFELPSLQADSYVLDIEDTGIAYQRTQMVKTALPWRYRGVLHEFLTCEGAATVGRLPLVMRRNHDGHRRRDPLTYRKDAALLEAALAEETDPFLTARYTFYLAQSWRDCGERERALGAYLRRAGQGHWDQEVYVSLLNAGRLMEAMGHPPDVAIGAYRAADAACAGRAEAAHAASRLCRQLDRFAEGYAFAKPAFGLPAPADGLFVEPWIYAYGLADELGVHAYWSGHYRDCLAACDRLLGEGRMPADMRPRIEANRRFAMEKLQAGRPAEPHGSPPHETGWAPARPQGGTELMTEGLHRRLGATLDRVNLCVNLYDEGALDGRPLVLWMHHDIDQQAVQWLDDKRRAARVDRFVFVSDWQRERYLARFDLPTERCLVLRNATEVGPERPWAPRRPRKMAYASAPYRGLSVLLDAWDLLRPQDAELHVWSSHRLYGPGFDDDAYGHLFERARATPGVVYHGIVPNEDLRASLRDCDFLAYPSTFAETSCLAAIEAMSAGCRVICPELGALPETVGRFGRLYPFTADVGEHAARFAEVLAGEMANPWNGEPALAVAQQEAVRGRYAWPARVGEWRALVDSLAPAPVAPRPRPDPVADRLVDALTRLRERGLAPVGVLDVGAYEGEFARLARSLFPKAHIRMVDALAENEPVLRRVCGEIGDAACTVALLGEEDGAEVAFFVADTARRPDLVKTGSSRFKENSAFPMHTRSIPQRRLDTILDGDGLAYGLVKLDVQGAEVEVLRGLGARLKQAEALIVEMSLVAYNDGAPLIGDVLPKLQDMGFVLHEIVEEHRYSDGSLLQIDGVFLRPASTLRLQPPFWR